MPIVKTLKLIEKRKKIKRFGYIGDKRGKMIKGSFHWKHEGEKCGIEIRKDEWKSLENHS
jgi:hypothetical protein